MTLSPIVSLLIIVLAVIIGDVLCGDATNIRQSSANVWPQLGNANRNAPANGPQGDPNAKSTTPWPALTQRRDQQRNDFTRSEQSNTRQAMWVRQNNSPNWVRNTPVPNQGPSQSTVVNANVRGNSQRNDNNGRNSSPPSSSTNYNTNFLNVERGSGDARPRTGSHQIQNQGTFTQRERGSSNVNNGLTSLPVGPQGGGNQRSQNTQNANMEKISHVLPAVEGGVSNNRPLGNIDRTSGPTSTGSMISGTPNQSEVDPSDSGDVEDYELREFAEELLSKETNNAARYVTINLQGKTTSRSTNDEAPLPLLSIDSSAYSIPSIEKLMLLYNNYIVEANENEVYTAQEKIEENNLLDTILSTPVMQHTRNFLIKKGKVGKDPKEFKDLLRLIWFNMYSRGRGRIGSSGFEHVFLAELKNNQVSGLHNWLYFNEEESKNRANYLGYMKKLDLGTKGSILKYHFTFREVDKPVGSMFIGTSPELEIALYSTCFILRADRICPLKMGGNKFIIRTYTFRYRGKNMIGSAFPEI